MEAQPELHDNQWDQSEYLHKKYRLKAFQYHPNY